MGSEPPSAALRGSRGSHLAGRTVALGVDAVRGAPGAVRIARELVRLGATVQPLAVPDALEWAPAAALEYAAGLPPRTWPDHASYDAVLLAPAGPVMVRKLALRVPDTAPLAAALGHLGRAPVLVAPARGVDARGLAELGAVPCEGFFDPFGEPRPEPLAARVAGALSSSPLRGKEAVVIGGGAFEPLDEMRVAATRGDSAVARALALELERRGARVRSVLGPWAAPHRPGERAFESGRDLAALLALLGPSDVALVEEPLPERAPVRQPGKIPSGQEGLGLQLVADGAAARAVAQAAPRRVAFRRDARAPEAQAAALADAAEAALR